MREVIEIKTFIPAKDFERSRDFYLSIGFEENWTSDDLAEFQFGQSRFLLQNFYEAPLAENLMMQLLVPDTQSWWQDLTQVGLESHFPEVRIKAPEVQPWGQTVMYLWEPSGVLWHIAEPIQSESIRNR